MECAAAFNQLRPVHGTVSVQPGKKGVLMKRVAATGKALFFIALLFFLPCSRLYTV